MQKIITYLWNWSLYVYPNFWRISDCCCQMITDFCKYLISEHRNDIFSAILWMTKKMSSLKIKLTDLQISYFHAPECCFLWWHTEKTFSLWGHCPRPHWQPTSAPRLPHHFPPFSLFPCPMSDSCSSLRLQCTKKNTKKDCLNDPHLPHNY